MESGLKMEREKKWELHFKKSAAGIYELVSSPMNR